jgi:putative endopeptidase
MLTLAYLLLTVQTVRPDNTPTEAAVSVLPGLKKSVAPGDDFFDFANGQWLDTTEIPPDKSSFGAGAILVEETRKRVMSIIQDSAAAQAVQNPALPVQTSEAKANQVTGLSRQVGDCYASFLDEATVEKKGLEPLKVRLATISVIADKTALAKALGETIRADVDPLNSTNFETPNIFGVWVAQGLAAPESNMPYLLQGGLELPDREYYLSESPKMAAIREKYLQHIETMFTLAQVPEAKKKAAQAFALEKKMAQVHATRLESEEIHAAIVWQRSEFATRAPGLDWTTFFGAAGLDKAVNFTVWHPKALVGLSALVASEPLEDWKNVLLFHRISAVARFLPKAFSEAQFEFFGKTLTGAQQMRERWKRAVDFTSGSLGDAVGQLYVEKHFSKEAKAQLETMVKDIVKAFELRVNTLRWMSPQTKAKAKEKLATLKIGVGYPETWRDYSALKISKDDLLGNAERASLFEYRYQLAKIGKTPDKNEWWMTPQTVNAVNLPLQNAMNFPAAYLQPPYFNPLADAALNYGAVGATIGHEISHSFDNVGSEFDAQGKLNNWWTPEDLKHFQETGKRLAAQFSAYKPFADLAVNGEQTLGENIADVAGLAAAFDAYNLSLKGKKAPVLEGYTGVQRFFIGYAQSWRQKTREPALRAQIINDGHAPDAYRAATVRNLDAWYTAFQVKPQQKLFLKPKERVQIW